ASQLEVGRGALRAQLNSANETESRFQIEPDSGGEELLIRVAAQVGERLNSDRGFDGRRFGVRAERRPHRRRGRLRSGPAPGADRRGDVLELQFAGECEICVDPALYLRMNRVRHQYAPPWSLRFEAGGDVHAVAIDVGSLADDVPEVDA